jgi:hypothetical protein
MGGPAKKAAEFSAKTWFLPTSAPYWAYRGGKATFDVATGEKSIGELFGGKPPPKPKAAPPPPDTSAAFFRELARQQTQRGLNSSRGRNAAMGGEPYRAPGSKTTTGA